MKQLMLSNTLASITGALILPLLWWSCADLLHIANPLLLPPLTSVVSRLIELIASGSLESDLRFTAIRWVLGYSIGVVSGITLGLVLGLSPLLRQTLNFPIEFLRAMPVTAIFPLFLIIFGLGDSSKIAMAFTPTFLLMLVNTTYGVTLCDPMRRRMARVFGATRFQIFRLIVARDALPQIFVGLRLALAQSLIVTVVSEMFIGTDFGVGQRIYDSYLTSSVPTMYALLIVVGVLGYSVNRVLVLVESRVVFWSGK